MLNSAAFCYFSLYEGFGSPILEALIWVFLLTSNVGSIKEYFSNYSVQLNPTSAVKYGIVLKALIISVAGKPPLLENLKDKSQFFKET